MEKIFTDDNFEKEVLKSPVPVLVDFWAPWCGPCKITGPIVEAVARDFDGKGASVGKLNVDEHPSVASRYNILSIPTLIIFKNGQPVDQMVGVQPKEKLEERLKKAMA